MTERGQVLGDSDTAEFGAGQAAGVLPKAVEVEGAAEGEGPAAEKDGEFQAALRNAGTTRSSTSATSSRSIRSQSCASPSSENDARAQAMPSTFGPTRAASIAATMPDANST